MSNTTISKIFTLFLISALTNEGFAQNLPSFNPTEMPLPQKEQELQSFRFEGADIDTVMTQYCEWTGKTYLKTDAVQAIITLRVDRLTTAESIQVVEAILAMNNIALVPMGDKFIKVVQAGSADLVGQGMEINLDPDFIIPSSDDFVTTVIPLQNVQIQEVQAAVQHILHTYGKILTLQRSNSIMITDTAANVNRARELIEFIDQATALIEQRIYKIEHADAVEIAAKIDEIITAAKGEEDKPDPVGNPYARTPAGVIRANANPATTSAPAQASIANTEGGNAVLIQGDVKVLADERTNIIIIFSQAENFPFFEKIIEVLDVIVEPETIFEVINLEYADAEELSGTLNFLIMGGGSSSSASGSRTSTSNRNNGSNSTRDNTNSRNTNNNRNTRLTPNAAEELSTGGIGNLNRLSEETTILADARSNSILLMGEKNDIAALKQVIAKLDVKLEQVMIEAAIFEVTLNNGLNSGIDWLYRNNTIGPSRAGGFGGQAFISRIATNVTQNIPGLVSGAMTYYESIGDISTELAISLAASDSNVRLLSTPVIITTDNTEATLSVGEQRPVVTSTSSFGNSSGTLRSSYEYKDIGINLTVTPRINPQRVVVMEILQQADQVGGNIEIDENKVPIILNREFEAQISVPDRGTIALGGLINTETRDSKTKIPILGDIPFIGRYLFSSQSQQQVQTELIVLLTPYVLTTDAELKEETERRYRSTDMNVDDWPKTGWSDSTLRYQSGESLKVLDETQRPYQQKSNISTILQNMKAQ
ncbi:MAG: type II secretion system secretin GspD [Pontiellaceae bacterium]